MIINVSRYTEYLDAWLEKCECVWRGCEFHLSNYQHCLMYMFLNSLMKAQRTIRRCSSMFSLVVGVRAAQDLYVYKLKTYISFWILAISDECGPHPFLNHGLLSATLSERRVWLLVFLKVHNLNLILFLLVLLFPNYLDEGNEKKNSEWKNTVAQNKCPATKKGENLKMLKISINKELINRLWHVHKINTLKRTR